MDSYRLRASAKNASAAHDQEQTRDALGGVTQTAVDMSAREAALYEEPFRWVQKHVYPMRQKNRRKAYRKYWWRHVEPRPKMWAALDGLSRYIVTPRVAKHTACSSGSIPASVPTRQRSPSPATTTPHSGSCTAGSTRSGRYGAGTSLEDRPRYTPTTTFATFPFPPGLAPDVPAAQHASDPHAMAVAQTSRHLVELRDRWLNPPEWVEWIDEPVPGYPKRPIPRDQKAAKALKKRTLTNLLQRPPAMARRRTPNARHGRGRRVRLVG